MPDSRSDIKFEYDPNPQVVSLRAYVKQLEAANARLTEQVGTDRVLFDSIRESLVAFPAQEPVRYGKPKGAHDELHVAVTLTDAHAEELVRPEEMEGLASYNFDTFLSRMSQTAAKTIELTGILRKSSPVRCLDIDCLGDWFLGKIHPQDEGYGASMPLPAALPRTGSALGRFVADVAPHFDHVGCSA